MGSNWPPGNVHIEALSESVSEIILQPRPSKDPNDPLNWPSWRKNMNFGFVSYYALMIFVVLDVATVTWGPMNRELGFGFTLLNDSYAAGCASLAIGALLLIPFALKFGRRPVYIFSTAVQCGLCVWLAEMKSVFDLMIPSIMVSFVGALAEVLVQMTVADVYFVHQRGRVNTIYYWIVAVGTSLPPVAGGYITLSQGWRWVWWWVAILLGTGLVGLVFLYEETMFLRHIDGVQVIDSSGVGPPVDKERQDLQVKRDGDRIEEAQPTRRGGNSIEEANPTLSSMRIDQSIPKKTYWNKLRLWAVSPTPFIHVVRHVYEPLVVLFTFPAILFMAVVYGITTTCATVTVTTLSSVMTLPPYNFGAQEIGLMGIPPFIGVSLSSLMCGPLMDWLALFLARRNGGVFKPEMRLWVPLVFTPFVPAGLFMFGIGLDNGTHWLLPAFGLALMGFGMVPASSAALTYLTDSYTEIIANALVGVTFMRNVISMVFVFIHKPWIERAGLTWFFVTFGLIVTVVLLTNLVFIRFGESMRVRLAHRYLHYANHTLQ